MKFGCTLIYVEDVLKTMEFYENAFGFERDFIYEDGGAVLYGELKTGETAIGFSSYVLGEMNFKDAYEKITTKGYPIGLELVFVDEDVEAATKKALRCGATLIAEPQDRRHIDRDLRS